MRAAVRYPKPADEPRSHRIFEDVTSDRFVPFHLPKHPLEYEGCHVAPPFYPGESVPGVLFPGTDEHPQTCVRASPGKQKMDVVGHEAYAFTASS